MLATCGGGSKRAMNPPSIGSDSLLSVNESAPQSLDDALAELAALETPYGVNPEIFEQLKDALTSQLESRFSNRDPEDWSCGLQATTPLIARPGDRASDRIVSTPPTGEANRVNDLTITESGDGTYTLSWHYRNLGDYDQDGTVGISDITAMALHFGEVVPTDDTSRNSLQAVIDSNGNGLVDIGDVNAIASHFGANVTLYAFEVSESYGGSWVNRLDLPLAYATGEDRLQFKISFQGRETTLYMRVVPCDSMGESGVPSRTLAYPNRSDWWMAGHDSRLTSRSSHTGPQYAQVKWIYDAGGRINSAPVFSAEGNMYITTERHVRALDTSGELLWYSSGYDLGRTLFESCPAIAADGTIYATSGESLLAFDVDGRKIWKKDLLTTWCGILNISPDGTIVLAIDGTKLVGLDCEGSQRFEFTADDSIISPCAIDNDGFIYFCCRDNHLYALKPNGMIRWKYDTGGYIESSPVIGDDRTVYFGGHNRYLTALNPDGSVKWKRWLGAVVGRPSISHDGSIYVRAGWRDLQCYSKQGIEKWSFEAEGVFWFLSPAISGDGTAYIGDDAGYVYAIDASGQLKWQQATGSSISAGPSIGRDGALYVATDDGLLYAFEGGEPQPPDIRSVSPSGDGAGDKAYFTAEVAGTWPIEYIWNFGEGAEPSQCSDVSPEVVLRAPGYHEGILRVTSAYGEDTYTFSYTVIRDDIWARTWSGFWYDLSRDVIVDSSGDSYVVGMTRSYGMSTPYWGDVFILKFDPRGNMLYAKTWGSWDMWYDEGARAAAVDQEDNLYVAGSMYRHGSSGTSDQDEVRGFILKYGKEGSLLWTRALPGSAACVAVGPAGNIYVAGGITATEPTSTYESDAMICGFSAEGESLFCTSWDAGFGLFEAINVMVISGSSIYLAGRIGTRLEQDGEALLLKADTSGNIVWSRIWEKEERDSYSGIGMDNSGHVLVTGDTKFFLDDGSPYYGSLIHKYDSQGNLLSSTALSGVYCHEAVGNLAVDLTGKVYLAGFAPGAVDGAGDVGLALLDSNGDLLSAKAWRGSGGNYCKGITVDRWGNVYIVGISGTHVGEWGSLSVALRPVEGTVLNPEGTVSTLSFCEDSISGEETEPEGRIDDDEWRGILLLKNFPSGTTS